MTTHTLLPPVSAVLVVDMQNDFFTQGKIYKRPIKISEMITPLETLIQAARDKNHPVFWIKSEYPERKQSPPVLYPPRPPAEKFRGIPMNNYILASGHAGRPCCRPGSEGAELHDQVAPMVAAGDHHIVKTRYSAFGETDLLEKLRKEGVTQVVLCGVTANHCIRATAVDAFFYGFDVIVASDATGAAKMKLWREGLQSIAKHYGEIDTVAGVLTRWRAARKNLGSGDTHVFYGVLPPEVDEDSFDAVQQEIQWQEMHHRGGPVPRLVSIQGSIKNGVEPLYRHPADEQPTMVNWTPRADALRTLASEHLGFEINHALIQLYSDGESYISPHADKTLDITRGTPIVGLSLGATRNIVLQSKDKGPDGKLVTQHLELRHGSLFVLGWETNQKFKHGIRQDRRADREKRPDESRNDGKRISLTMRSIATFLTPDGVLFGQGARRKRLSDPSPTPLPPEEEAEQMLLAFGEENRSSSFDWDGRYGPGFDTLNFQILRDHD